MYLHDNPNTTTMVMFKELRKREIFKDTDFTSSVVDAWLLQQRPKVQKRPPATISDLLAINNKYLTPLDTILAKGENEALCLPLRGCSNVVYGKDIRPITGEDNPKKTSGGLQYNYLFPGTTRRLFSRVQESREQTYLIFEKITIEDGPMFKKIKSLGLDLTDGVWGLIEANAGILLRCGTVTRNNHIREFGLGVACGESGWAVNQLKFAFQQL